MLFLHSPFASLQIASISQKKKLVLMSSASVFVPFDQGTPLDNVALAANKAYIHEYHKTI